MTNTTLKLLAQQLQLSISTVSRALKDHPDISATTKAKVNALAHKKAFINAQIVELSGKEWVYSEGCLSIPKIREDVSRYENVTLSYMDENFEQHTETFTGMTARVILHEYDHIEGKLFIDYVKPLKRKMLQGKLNDINKGKVRVDYKMIQLK
jgi:peptide deformylase